MDRILQCITPPPNLIISGFLISLSHAVCELKLGIVITITNKIIKTGEEGEDKGHKGGSRGGG